MRPAPSNFFTSAIDWLTFDLCSRAESMAEMTCKSSLKVIESIIVLIASNGPAGTGDDSECPTWWICSSISHTAAESTLSLSLFFVLFFYLSESQFSVQTLVLRLE